MNGELAAFLAKLGVDTSAAEAGGVLRGSEGDGTRIGPGDDSAAPGIRIALETLDQLRELFATCGAASATVAAELEPWPSEKAGSTLSDLDDGEERQLRRALATAAHGQPVPGYEATLAELYFPMFVTVFAGDELFVKSGETFCIGPSHDPIILRYSKVTLEEGGHIRCEAPVVLCVDQFVKTKKEITDER